MNTLDALAALDPAKDEHWTTQGQPVMAVMQEMTGNDELTRKEINDVAPGFTRDHYTLPDPELVFEGAESTEPGPIDLEAAKLNGDELRSVLAQLPEEKPAEEAIEPSEDEKAAMAAKLAEHNAAKAAEVEAAKADHHLTQEMVDKATETANAVDALVDEEPLEAEQEISEEEALAMPDHQVRYEYETLKIATGALTREIGELQQARGKIDVQLHRMSLRCDQLTNWMLALEKADPKKQMANTLAYIKQQNINRANKAAAAQRFIAAGTTAKDVAEAMNPRSKIDQALNQRKQARGAARPTPRQMG